MAKLSETEKFAKLWHIPDAELDFKAKWVLMGALSYYSLDTPVINDGVFDNYTKECVARWDSLSPARQWLLGSQEELASSGYHVKVTWAIVHSLQHALKLNFFYIKEPRRSNKFNIDWFNVNDFRMPYGEYEWTDYLIKRMPG